MAGADSDLDQTFEIIERDAVPAPPPQPNESTQKRIDELRKWLQPTDFLSPGNEFMKHLHSYVPGTGKWIHKSPVFRTWASSELNSGGDSSCLHVRGVAGSGKSVFAASTIRQLQESGKIVLFFFFRQIVDKNHSAKYLVRDFATQLLPHCPGLVLALTTISEDHAINGNEINMLWPAIVKALTESNVKNVFCVVDALDEMDDGDFEGMVQRLVELNATGSRRVRIMMTSRPLPRIEESLNRADIVKLKLDPALLSPDVARYVDARMATLDPPLSNEKNELVKQTICERANGLFLHARLVADNLADGLRDGHITEETLPDSLDRLPRTLNDVYENMLREHARRSGVTAEQQAKVLMCVIHASRPLRLIELGSLLSNMLHFDLRRGKDLVRQSCGRLLELLEDESVSVIHHSFTEFLHDKSRRDSVDAFPVLNAAASHGIMAALILEYLNGCPPFEVELNNGRETRDRNRLQLREDEKKKNQFLTDLRTAHPLVSYAADNLTFHLEKSANGPLDHVQEALTRYIAPGRPAFETWKLMNQSTPGRSSTVFHFATTVTHGHAMPLFVVEHFGKTEPTLIDTPNSSGRTALSYAAEHGLDDAVRFLLANGADPKSGGCDGRMPLHWAALRGRPGAVQLLLDAGVDPLIKTHPVLEGYDDYEEEFIEYSEEEVERRRETALAYAFRGDDTQVVQAFMPFVQPTEVNQCLHRVDDLVNVEAVLSTGMVDIDCLRDGETKLFRAAKSGQLELVKLLLKHGADATKRSADTESSYFYNGEIQLKVDNDQGPTPLHGITHPYHRDSFWEDDAKAVEECIQVLIAAGADVNATMAGATSYKETNLTPLHLAVKKPDSVMGCSLWDDKSDEMLTKFLLEAGADPNAKASYGNTAMHLANPRKPCLFEMLAKHGADVNAKNHRGRTPLLEIINCIGHDSRNELKPNVDVFTKLLDLGADVHATDDHGNNVFHHIMHSIRILSAPTFSPFIRKLVDAGVDLNARNQQNHPPLWSYNKCVISTYQFDVTKEEEDMLRVLVDAGMDLNVSDDDGETILWGVCRKFVYNTRVMEKFIRMGADPTILAKDGTSLLQVVAKSRRPEEWFRYLISVGTNTEALDVGGDSLIHSVVQSHREGPEPLEVIQVLVEAGAAPLAKNAKGQTVLHVVKTMAMLEFVLKSPIFRGLDINAQDVDGSTPLHSAMDMVLPDQAAWSLLRVGADPTILMTGDLSVLHIASRVGHASAVGLLLSEYRKLGVLEKHVNLLGEGRAPLHYACRSGRPESVWLLLCSGADPQMVDDKGLTPLHALVEFKATGIAWSTELTHMDDIVAMLQNSGVDLAAQADIEADGGTKTATALDLAVEKKCWELARALVTRGAEAHNSYKQSLEFISAIDKGKAAERARIATAAAPLYEDIEDWDKHLRWRGRWSAPQGADPPHSKVRWYISGGQAIFDAPAKDPEELDQLDLLKYALHDGDSDSIKEFALLGGDIIRLDKSGKNIFNTLLHLLVEGGYTDLLEYFSDKVPIFEAQPWVQTNEQGCGTLLGVACMRQPPSLNILQLLVDKIGVDVNAVFNRQGCHPKLRGCTATHILASGESFWQIEALEYLLSRGANIEARNKQGLTPLLAALDHGHPKGFWREETIRLLVKHGADVNATAWKYENTLTSGINSRMSCHSALEMSDQAGITKLLLENGVDVRSVPDLIARTVKKWMDPGSVKLLLEAGLDPNELPQPELYDEVDDEDEDEEEEIVLYALHETCRPSTITNPPADFELRKQAMLDLLLSHGADPLARYTDGKSVIQCIVEEQGQIGGLLPRLSKSDMNLKGHHGRTLLTSACIPTIPITTEAYRRNRTPPTIDPSSVLALLEHGADTLAVDDDGRTPLHWLCTLPGNFDEMQRRVLIALIEQGPAAINMADKQGRKPFHIALLAYSERSQNSLFAIQHLIETGSNVAEPDPITGNSTLHQIAPRLGGHAERATEAASFFRELSDKLDINARNNLNQTPVMTFVGVGWEGTRDPTNNIGHPTYAIAHDVTHASALDVFVDLGADLTLVDARDQTLLHVVARRPLPDSSSDWDQRDDLEGTFKKLMDLGVDPRREGADLRTAIDVAVARNLHGIINLFRKRGEDKGDDEGSNGDGDDDE